MLIRSIAALGLVAGMAAPLSAAPLSASPKAKANATLVKPLSLLKLGDLDFGQIAAGTTAGTVTVDPTTDVRTVTGGVTALGGTPLAARYISYGTRGSLLLITRGALPTLTRAGGTETMAMTNLTLNGAGIRVIAADGTLDLRVGGTLAIAANQVEGLYAGDIDIFVNYF